MLFIENIYLQINNQPILHDVSLTISRGEIVGLSGQNGSGKTTLFKAVMGLIRPCSGNIRLKTTSIVGLPTCSVRQLGIGYVPQTAPVFPWLTVEQNLQVASTPTCSKKQNTSNLLSLSGMQPLISKLMPIKAGLLSRGQKQLVALAMVIVGNPKVLLLDEPFAPLSEEVKDAVVNTINFVVKKNNISTIIVEHDLSVLNDVADRFCEMVITSNGSYIEELS